MTKNKIYLEPGKLYYVRNSHYVNGYMNNKHVCMPYNAPLLCLRVVDEDPDDVFGYGELHCEFLYGVKIFKTKFWKLTFDSFLKDSPDSPAAS